MTPSNDMTTGVAERVAYGLILGICMKLVANGYLNAEMAPYAATGIISAFGGAWAWWINRPKAILQSASAVVGDDGKKTMILASPELAKDTPNEKNIISNLSKPAEISAAVKENINTKELP